MSTALPAAALADEPLARVLAFSRRFGRETTALAMHAALPLGLSPELVHLLRVNFVPRAPWIAEADLLLSPLCMEAGGGMYEMDPDVRELLLAEMARTPGLGPARQRQVAQFLRLWAARALNDAADPDQQEHLRVQQWVALAYAEPARAAEELAGALRAGVERGSRPEVARVARLTAILSAPLAAEVELRRYAGTVQRVAAGAAAPVSSGSGAVTVGGEALPALDDVVRLWRPAQTGGGGSSSGAADEPVIQQQANVADEPIQQQGNVTDEPIQQQANVADEPIQQQANVVDEPIQQQANVADGPIQQGAADAAAFSGYRVARVLVVGDNGAGKSGLVSRITGRDLRSRGGAGSDSRRWIVDRRGEGERDVVFVDAPAEDLPTFLPGDAAAIVLVVGPGGRDVAEGWLRRAGGTQPILVVQSTAAENPPPVPSDLAHLASEPRVAAIRSANVRTGHGIAELRDPLVNAIDWSRSAVSTSRADVDALEQRIEARLGSSPVAAFGEGTRRELGAPLDSADPEGALARAMDCLAARDFVRAIGDPAWAVVRSEDYARCLGEVWRFVGEARHDVRGLPAAPLHALQEHFATHGLTGYLDADPTPGVLDLVIEDLVRRRWAYEVDARRGQLVVIPSLQRRDGAPLPSTAGPALLQARWDGRVDDGFVLLLVRLGDQGQVELINGRCAFATVAEATVRLDASEGDGMAQVTVSSEQAVRDPRPLRELIRREITGALHGIAPPHFIEPTPESPPRTDMQPPEGVDLARACLVMPPLGDKLVGERVMDFDAVWERLFRPAVEEVRLADGAPLVAVRVELPPRGVPLPDWMKAAPIVLVDLTGADAAHVRELGLVPGARTQHVVLVQETSDPPRGIDDDQVLGYVYGRPDVLVGQRELLTQRLSEVLGVAGGGNGAGGEVLVVTADQLNVREGPGSDQPVLGRLPKGARMEVLKEEGEWVLVQAHDHAISGWISRKFTSPESPPAAKGAEPAPRRVRVTASALNLRTGPGTDQSVIRQLATGTILDPLDVSPDRQWMRVRSPDGEEGWVASRFVQAVDGDAATNPEPVAVVALAPARVHPNETVTVGLVLYAERHRKRADEYLLNAASWANEHRGPVLTGIQPGTSLLVRARPPWSSEIKVAELEWNGSWGPAGIRDTVPPDAAPGSGPLVVEITRSDGTILQTMELDVEIVPSEGAEEASPVRTAFACYAAADRKAVMSRVAALRAATGVDVLVGEESVQGGKDWEKRLDAEICSRDVFLLFWSPAAAGSRVVRRDWRRALECFQASGKPEIQIHLLKEGTADLLPEELRQFHAKPAPETPVVLISSARSGMQEYRDAVMEACEAADVIARAVDDIPADGFDAIRASIDAVNEADLYIGILAHRYGYVPEGSDVSVVELEYNRALDRGIPIAFFMQGEETRIPVTDMEPEVGEAAEKLEAFKRRVRTGGVVEVFRDLEDLRLRAIRWLILGRTRIDAAQGTPPPRRKGEDLP